MHRRRRAFVVALAGMLVAPDNSVLVALYTMEKQKDGRWRIAGCVLAPSTVQAA